MIRVLFSYKYWKAISLLMFTSIARQNKNTFLGSIWGLIQPFIHILVITYFFGFLLKQSTNRMIENLVGALPFWSFLMSGLFTASNSLVSREAIIKRAVISKTYFPISDILAHAYALVYSFVAMYGALILYYPDKFHINIIFIPLLSLPLIISIIAAGVAVAFLTPYVRDIPQFINVILGVVYWTVPIIYPFSLIPENKHIFFEYNPVYLLLKPMQDLVVNGQILNYIYILKSWIICGMIVMVSLIIYKKLARNVIYYL